MTSLIKHVNRYAVTKTGLELFANFYYPPKCQDGKPKGLFVAYHGGGVIVGSRDEEFIFEPVKRECSHDMSIETQGVDLTTDLQAPYWTMATSWFNRGIVSWSPPPVMKSSKTSKTFTTISCQRLTWQTSRKASNPI